MSCADGAACTRSNAGTEVTGQPRGRRGTEPELVELGYWIGFTFGGQRWLKTLGAVQGEFAKAMNARHG